MEGLRIRETRREHDERKTKVSRESFVLDLVQNYSLEQLKASNLDQPIHQKILPMTEAAAARAAELARLEAEYAATNDFETLLRINEIRKGV